MNVTKVVYNLNTHNRFTAEMHLHDISKNGYNTPFFLMTNGNLIYDSVFGYSYMPYFTDGDMNKESYLDRQFRLYFGVSVDDEKETQ